MRRRAGHEAPEGTGLWVGIILSTGIAALAVGLAVFAANVTSTGPVPPPRPDPDVALDAAARAAVHRQTQLVADEDVRLLAQLRALPFGAPAYVDRSSSIPTAVLTPRRTAYGIDDLVRLGAVVRPAPGVMELVMSVLVAPGARLEVDAPGTVLRMVSTPTGFTSLVAWKAALTLSGAPGRPLDVQSWDATAGGQDLQTDDGRSYVRAISSELRIASVVASALGFWSGRTGGIAFTGDDDSPSTGAITDSAVLRSRYGLFTSHVRNLSVERVVVEEANADGVLFHRGTVGVQVHDLAVVSSGADGVAAGRGSSAVSLSKVVVEGSGGNGITVDGRPLVNRPGPSGASPEGSRDFRISNSVSRGNARAGILVWDADDAIVLDNEVDGNAEGVIVRGPASGVAVRDNTVTRSTQTGIGVRDGPGVVVAGNHVAGATTGVQVRNADAVVTGNRTENLTAHGVSVQGASGGSTVVGNDLAGRGPSALDLYRLDAGAPVTVADNTTESWEDYRTLQQRIRQLFHNHPLLPLWVLLLAVPVVSTTLARLRRRRGSQSPYGSMSTVADLVRRTEPARSTVEASGTRVTVVAAGWERKGRSK